MSNPKWITNSGSLGEFEEEVPATILLSATPHTVGNTLVYTLLNGDFPKSISTASAFNLNSNTGVITFTPASVSEKKEYKFTVRLNEINDTNSVVSFSDRTFSVIINGPDDPEFITPSGELFTSPYYLKDSEFCQFQIQYLNKDPGATPKIELALGNLPAGLQLTSTGLIRGYADKPVDNNGNPITKTYTFTLQLTTLTGSAIRQFSITVYNQELIPGFTGRKPVIANISPFFLPLSIEDTNYPYYSLSGVIDNNFQEDNFIFKILGKSFDNNPISYKYSSTFNLPIIGTRDGVNYLVTPDTGLLSLGQQIEFLPPTTGGLIPNKNYYVRQIIDKNYFQVSTSKTGNVQILDTSMILMYADMKLPPGLFDHINYTKKHVKISVSENNVNTGYQPGDIIKISGDNIGGVTPNNDMLITIKSATDVLIFDLDSIEGINTAANLSVTNIVTESVTGTGSGLKVDIEKVGAEWLLGRFEDLPTLIDTYTMTFVALDEVTKIESDPVSLKFLVTNKTLTDTLNTNIIWQTESDLGTLNVGETSLLKLVATLDTNLIKIKYRVVNPEVYTIETGNILVSNSTSYVYVNQPITFIEKLNIIDNTYFPKFGNVELNKIYYIKEIYDNIRFSISETINGPIFDLGAGNGVMIVNVMLPPNLTLLETGEISGKVDFQLDTNVFEINTTMTYNFTVEAYSESYSELSTLREFKLSVTNNLEKPYENIYLKAFLKPKDRSALMDMIWDYDIFPEHIMYRKFDYVFYRSTEILYNHLVGLNVTDINDYIQMVTRNHYGKKLVLGPAESAIAINNNEIEYEVVFSRLIDNLVNKSNESISKEIIWVRNIPEYGRVVYPNSLINMKQQLLNNVDVIADSSILPLWMKTIQKNKTSLGFIPCWVLCYTKPNKSEEVVTKFNNKYKLNELNFEIDRFIVDRSLTYNYDPDKQSWLNLPSSGVNDDSNDMYVYFNRKNILR